MKALLISLLVLGVVGCQPQSKPAARATPATQPAAPRGAAGSHQPAAAPPVHAPASSQAAAFLRRHDLTPLFQNQYEAGPLHLDGFYGPDHYRMELVLTSVRRDPAHPNRYLLAGKDRYKKIITPLAGYVDVTSTGKCPVAEVIAKGVELACTVQGTYELREDATVHGAGVFRGRFAADIGIASNHSVERTSIFESAAGGGSLTFAGKWTSLATGQQKAATWVLDVLGYRGQQTASDFLLGDRMTEINPKYAKYGWRDFWENDEWWADSLQPKPNL